MDESDDEDEEGGGDEEDDLIAADDAAEVAQAEAAAAARAADAARAARERRPGDATGAGGPGGPGGLRDIANMTEEELAAHLKDRYGGRAGAGGAGGDGVGPVAPSAAPAALPGHDDPKLWVVETRNGQEREAVICLMQKAVDRAAGGAPLDFKAAIAHDHLRGYIYVEAHKEAHVLDAIRGLRPCLTSKGTRMVPLGEMPDALAVTRESAAAITPGAWVRIRAGAYRGDLARVTDVNASAGRAEVQLVPRLDYAAKAAAAARTGPGGGARGGAGAARPAPRGFSLADAKAARLFVDKRKHPGAGDGYAYYLDGGGSGASSGAGPFVDGYLLKEVSLKGLALEAGVPPLDEVQRFAAVGAAARDAARSAAAGLEDDDEDEGGGGGAGRAGAARVPGGASELASLLEGASVAAAAGSGAAAAAAYVKGDKVVVTVGDLAGLHGRVLGAAPGAGPGAVLVKPVGEFEDVEPQAIPAAHLAKHFEAGDHVKVTGGAHEGATGMVVRVDGPVCHVFSDAAREEVRVFARDLAESAEVAAGGLDALGQYELHDFVVLDAATVGVIVAVDKGKGWKEGGWRARGEGERSARPHHSLPSHTLLSLSLSLATIPDAVRVLTNQGALDVPDIRTARLVDIKRKLLPRATTTQDRAGNPVTAGDLVSVGGDGGGRLAGRAATVRLAFRQHLFIHSRDIPEHGGFACVRGRQCALRGGGGGGGGGGAGSGAPRGGFGGLPMKSPAPHRFGVAASPAPHRQDGPGGGAPLFAPRSAAAPAALGGGGGRAPVRSANATLVGRRVTVAKGHLRGYAARVLSATDTHARLELEAGQRTVTVALACLSSEDTGAFARGDGGMGGGMGAGMGGMAGAPPGSRTPAGATPMHGGATPMHPGAWGGGATPLHPGAVTPGGDGRAWGAPTPAHYSSGGGGGFGGATPLHPSIGGDDGGGWGAAAAAARGGGGGGGGGGAYGSAGGGASADWRGVAVALPGGGAGIVASTDNVGNCEVEDAVEGAAGGLAPAPGGGSRWVAAPDVRPLPPAKGGRARVLRGPYAGATGEVINFEGGQTVVRLGDGQVAVVPADAVGAWVGTGGR